MNLMIALVLVLVIAVIAGQWFVWQQVRSQRQRDEDRDQQLQRLTEDFAALCRASAGAGDHVVKLEQQLRSIVDRQDQWELRASGDRSYQQAIQLVQKGAGAEELMKNCGLTRGEAELIAMLHGMAKAS